MIKVKQARTIQRRAYFSIKGSNIFTENSIGNYIVLLDPLHVYICFNIL